MESDGEYEEFLPSVIMRWNAFEEGEKNAKQYTAFLRFVFNVYNIPARVHIRWMNQKRRRSNKCQVLQILYDGRARTMKEMRDKFEEIWEITRAFPTPLGLEYPCIKYSAASQIWEKKRSNGLVYARMVMCVGKGTMPYLPAEIRKAITGNRISRVPPVLPGLVCDTCRYV